MSTIDVIIVLTYLALLFCWAIFIGMRENVEDFLVFSRRAPFLLVMFSLVSTWVGVGTTVATAASGYDKGISLGVTAACGGLVGAIVAGWFAPRLKWFGDKFGAHTIGDFYKTRFSGRTRLIAGGFILIVYTLLTAAQFVGLTVLLRVWTGYEYQLIVWFAGISTIIYTAFAGIKSDFYTDIIHFFVMCIVFFFVMLPMTFTKFHVIDGLAALPASYFDPFAYGGSAFFISGLLFGAGCMFVTMDIWQRVYASSSAKVAKWALYSSALVIVAFYLLSSFFGLVARIGAPGLDDRDKALFVVMIKCLPHGFLGLGMAAFIAAFVSTVNSMLMVLSATLTKDFYKAEINPTASSVRLLWAGRVSTLVGGAAALGVAIIFPNLVALAVNALFMLLILVPSMLGGFFWRRATAKAASHSIIAGSAVLLCLLPWAPETAFVPAFLVALLLFLISSVFTKHSSEENLEIVNGWLEQALLLAKRSEKP
jgi:SSS family solute:Na+ symporter